MKLASTFCKTRKYNKCSSSKALLKFTSPTNHTRATITKIMASKTMKIRIAPEATSRVEEATSKIRADQTTIRQDSSNSSSATQTIDEVGTII